MDIILNDSKLLFAILYAGDTCLILNGKKRHDLIQMLNAELELLCVWFK